MSPKLAEVVTSTAVLESGVVVRFPSPALSSLFRLILAFLEREVDGGKGLGKGLRWRFLWMASRISSMRDLNACNALKIRICLLSVGLLPSTTNFIVYRNFVSWEFNLTIYSGGKNKWDKIFHKIGKSAVTL